MFDVVDPDNFEVTFAGEDWSDLHESVNVHGVFIGVVPADEDLSRDWEPCKNPLPDMAPGPFDMQKRMSFSWARVENRFPLSRDASASYWPDTVYVPPAFQHGIAVTITVALFANVKSNESTDYRCDGFLTQSIVRGRVENEAKCSKWWDRRPYMVGMRFNRSQTTCVLRIVITDGHENEVVDEELDFASLGLDCKLPYRPVVFMGTKQAVDVANHFPTL